MWNKKCCAPQVVHSIFKTVDKMKRNANIWGLEEVSPSIENAAIHPSRL